MKRQCGPLFDNHVEFDVFPASASNEITYECYCLMGAAENDKLCCVLRRNGKHTYFTYHNISRL
jgi:hypothetical protein